MLGDMTARNPARTSLAAAVVDRYVASAGWTVAPTDDGGVMTLVEDRHGAWACVLTPVGDDEVVLIESIAPLTVPPQKFLPVAELLALVNDDLLLGAFCVERASGTVRHKVAVDLEALGGAVADPAELGAALIASPVVTSTATMDRWLAAISVVVHGDTPPPDAVAAILARP